MNPQDMQPNNQQQDTAQHSPMTPDDAAAALGFATNLSNHLLMPQAPQQPQMQQQVPQTMDTPDTETPAEDKTEPQEEPKTESVDTTKQDEEKMQMFKDTLEKTVQEISTKYESKLQDSDKKAKGAIEAIKKEVKSILNG